MRIPIARDLGGKADFTPRMAAGQGRAADEAFSRTIKPPHEAAPPKPKVEKLPSINAYHGLMMRGR